MLGHALCGRLVVEGARDDGGGLQLEALDDAPEVAPHRPEEVDEQYRDGQRELPLELQPRVEQGRLGLRLGGPGVRVRVRVSGQGEGEGEGEWLG